MIPGWAHTGNPEEDFPATERQVKALSMYGEILGRVMTEEEKQWAAFEGSRWLEVMTKGLAGSLLQRVHNWVDARKKEKEEAIDRKEDYRNRSANFRLDGAETSVKTWYTFGMPLDED